MSALYIVYEHSAKIAATDSGFVSTGQYHIVKFFNNGVPIEKKVLDFCYQTLFEAPPTPETNYYGPFAGLNELKSFAYRLCQEARLSSVSLFQVSEFNACILEAKDKEEFKQHLGQRGEQLKNLDSEDSSGNFLKKFFT